ncbi:carbohydrate binding domain-containing protein [Paenibacillus mesophilus]|uniref:carbohydrate binding domain-containing protein n=1 Tax=Paenibacillus mesophilus TaxID=2582849 RepID=UPI003082D793
MTIPLGITGYRAQLLYGDTRSVLDGQSDGLTINLGPMQALMYRITPFENMMSEAMALAVQASGLSADAQWTSRMNQLEVKLNEIRDHLIGADPDPAAAVQTAIQTLHKVEQLSNWADQNGSGTSKPDMLAAIERLRAYLGPIAASYTQSELYIGNGQLVGQEELNELSFTLRNGAQTALQNVRVTLKFPEAFGLEPETRTVTQLGSGQSIMETFSFRIAEPLLQKSYRLQAVIEFEYSNKQGVPITTDTFIYTPYTDLLTAKREPDVIMANKGGSYPFTLNVKNNVPRSLQVGFEPVLSSSGMNVQLPSPLLLQGNQQATVNGTVYLPMSVTDGVYTATIQVKADGKIVQSIPLQVRVDKNKLTNPGFEQVNAQGTGPAGWLMRKGSWVQDAVYAGQYAVSLQPDAANSWNVINSDLIAIEPGTKYVWKGWAKNGASAGNVSIGLRQVRENGSSTISYTWKEIHSASDWTYYELEIMPASTAKYLQVYLKSDTNVNGTAWFDDLYVGEIANN